MPLEYGMLVRPIGVAEVSSVIGENSLDVGTLCRSSKINMWSRKKPMYIGPDKPDSPDWDDNIWREFHFGIQPKGGDPLGRYTFNQIKANDEWNESGWGFEPWTGSGFYRLTDFDGYNHNAIAPFDVPGLLSTSYKGTSADSVVLDIVIPITANMGCISLADLFNVEGNYHWSDYHLCMLFYCTKDGGSRKNGTWYVKVDKNTLGSYISQSGTIGQISMPITASELGGAEYKWWLCGLLMGTYPTFDTFVAAPSQIIGNDSSTYFVALPSSRPETCRGTLTYDGAALPKSDYDWRVSFFGVNNNDYWSPSLGLQPMTTTMKFGQMLLDYNYGLQLGLTLTNGSAQYSYDVKYRLIKVTISRTFFGNVSKDVVPQSIYTTTSTSTGVSLDGKVSVQGTGLGDSITLGPGEKVNLILDLGQDVMGLTSDVATGQKFTCTVKISIDANFPSSEITFTNNSFTAQN